MNTLATTNREEDQDLWYTESYPDERSGSTIATRKRFLETEELTKKSYITPMSYFARLDLEDLIMPIFNKNISILIENMETIIEENKRLQGIVSDLVNLIKEEYQKEKVIILKEISHEEAKEEIKRLFNSGEILYYSDIAEKLRIELKQVVEICQELQQEGEIEIANTP